MLNFEIAEHLVYDSMELQWYDDAAHGTGMHALLTRRDTHLVDCYRNRACGSILRTSRSQPGPLPDLSTLTDGIHQAGQWSVSADAGRLTGGRFAERRGDRVLAGLDVTERWKPRNLPLLLRAVTTVVPVFRRWPTTYRWRASIGPQGETSTGWTRTSAARTDDYRRATGS